MKWMLTLMVVLVYLLHQALWFWHDRTLVLGFLPIGLAYHAAYSILAAIMMAVLVRFAWPGHLEDDATGRGGDGEMGRGAESGSGRPVSPSPRPPVSRKEDTH